MAVYDVSERLNWQQACVFLGCSKSMLYRRVKEGKIPIYGIGKRFRWFLRGDLEQTLMGSFPSALLDKITK